MPFLSKFEYPEVLNIKACMLMSKSINACNISGAREWVYFQEIYFQSQLELVMISTVSQHTLVLQLPLIIQRHENKLQFVGFTLRRSASSIPVAFAILADITQ